MSKKKVMLITFPDFVSFWWQPFYIWSSVTGAKVVTDDFKKSSY